MSLISQSFVVAPAAGKKSAVDSSRMSGASSLFNRRPLASMKPSSCMRRTASRILAPAALRSSWRQFQDQGSVVQMDIGECQTTQISQLIELGRVHLQCHISLLNWAACSSRIFLTSSTIGSSMTSVSPPLFPRAKGRKLKAKLETS